MNMVPKNKISNEMIHACYIIGKEWASGSIARAEVDERLEDVKINNTTGWGYVSNYRNLVDGREFARTMNLYATRYYLTKIFKNKGEIGLQNALMSLMLHIKYYEGLSIKTHCKGLRKIHAEFLKIL